MRQKWTEEQVKEEILTPIQEGSSVIDVARSLDMTRQRVYFLLRQFGLKTPRELRKELRDAKLNI